MKNNYSRNLSFHPWGYKSAATDCRLLAVFLAAFLASQFCLNVSNVFAGELALRLAPPPPPISSAMRLHTDQLPQSRIARGNRNITSAWFAEPTDRYRHGVLGDALEGSRLVVETTDGNRLHVDLPISRVFEDLEPRLADLDGDQNDEIIVVETDTRLGASLAVYGIVSGHLRQIAATPFLGQPNRWLNPVGVGDFDGDGHPDLALVATPHIGGKLRLYRFRNETLSLFAEHTDVSTHQLGSTELGLGRVIQAKPRDRLLVPNQTHRALLLLEWTADGWQEITRAFLPDYLGESLVPLAKDRWGFRLRNGKYYEIQLKD